MQRGDRYAPFAAAGPHEASVNAATIPRVATASGDRALEKSYKPKKLLYNVSSFLLIWWILPAMIPEQFMLDEAVDPRGDWTAMGLRASLFTAKTFRWMHLADGHPAMEIGIRWCLIVILTLFGQWVCAAASRRLAIILMRDRNLSKRDADHPLQSNKASEKNSFWSAGLKPHERFDAISFTKHIRGQPVPFGFADTLKAVIVS